MGGDYAGRLAFSVTSEHPQPPQERGRLGHPPCGIIDEAAIAIVRSVKCVVHFVALLKSYSALCGNGGAGHRTTTHADGWS